MKILLASICLVLTTISAQAQLTQAYWSFNNDNLSPDLGTATLTAAWSGIGVGLQSFTSGTTENAQPSFPAGSALTFLDPVNTFSNHHLTLSGLDFTNRSSATLSFASLSTQIFDIGESSSVYYRLPDLNSQWVKIQDIALPTSSWDTYQITLPSLLNNQSNVDLQIRQIALFEVGSVLKYDNLTVTAVPEPSTGILISGLLLLLLAARHRQKALA